METHHDKDGPYVGAQPPVTSKSNHQDPFGQNDINGCDQGTLDIALLTHLLKVHQSRHGHAEIRKQLPVSIHRWLHSRYSGQLAKSDQTISTQMQIILFNI